MVTMPLGNLAAGSYSVTLDVSGKITDVTLVDSSGGDYPTTVSSDGKTVTFSLSQDTDAVGLNAVTTDDTLTISYKAKKSVAGRLEAFSALYLVPVAIVMILL